MDHLTIVMPIEGKNFVKDVFDFIDALDTLVVKKIKTWAFSEKIGFHETLPTDIGNGFNVKIAVNLPGVETITTYLPLAEPKGVILTMIEGVIYLNPKHKFNTIHQCILNVLEVLNDIQKEENIKCPEISK